MLLPPANEVCEGYVFTGVFVCPRGGGGLGLCLGGVSAEGDLCPGRVSVWGGSLSMGVSVEGGVSVREIPPAYGSEWAVHILPECIVVLGLDIQIYMLNKNLKEH